MSTLANFALKDEDRESVDGTDQFYVQDARNYVGNDILWWQKDNSGYVTGIAEARVFSRKEAYDMQNSRSSDVPWPKDLAKLLKDLPEDMKARVEN